MGLNTRQVEILQWIADGAPERDWPDWTHRATAKALQSRGLVRVRGHGSAWTATITERGQRVLAGKETVPTRGPRSRVRTGRQTRQSIGTQSPAPVTVRVDPEDLISDVTGAVDHTLRIPAPDSATRAGYRRALAAIPADLVPTGKRVTHTGRYRGDLVIRLADLPAPVTPDPSVTVPSSLDPGDPLIAWLIRNPDHLDVAENSRDRALRIVQGVAAALTGRGHAVSRPRAPAASQLPPRPDTGDGWSANTREASAPQPDAATFEVTIGDETLTIDLYEEQQKVSTVPPEEAANLKYDWQRATPVEHWEFNGRLALRLRGRARDPVWADRKRWTLESRLPRVLRAIEEAAQDLAQARQRADEAKRQRRQQWEQALPNARAAYLADLNRGRLDKQLNLFHRAEELRRYADAVTQRAADLPQDERDAAEGWAAWIHAEADRHDPTLNNANLVYSEPPEIGSWDLDKYMPPGFRASGPPD